MKKKDAQRRWTSAFYENAFTPVPAENRKKTSNVLIVTLGYVTALSCLIIGSKVGDALPFWQAVSTCVIGNLILMAIGVFMGIMGCESGWSTTFIVRKMFGKHASMLVSGLIILLSIYWVGMNGDSLARMIVTAFPGWRVPVAVTAVILVALWGFTAAYGWQGLAVTSSFLTPPTILMAVSGLVFIGTKINIAKTLQDFVPSGNLTVTMAIAAVTGNYIFGCIISPDLCRFAKSKKAVVWVILPSYTVGFILLNICGVIVAQLGNSEVFGVGVARLGLAAPYLICSAAALFTTENYNMYGGSLAAQNLFLGTAVEGNLSHGSATWILAGLSAAFAALKALNYLMPIITLISALVPPVAGMMFAEYFLFSRYKKYHIDNCVRWAWIPSWILGGMAGVWSYYEKILISPVNALLVSCIVYSILRIAALFLKREPRQKRITGI